MDNSWYLGLGVAVIALLTGCGGSGSSGGGGDPANTTAKPGLYLGVITQGSKTGDSTLLLSVASDGSARLIEQAQGTYAKGRINFDGNGSFTGSIEEFVAGRKESSGKLVGTSTTNSFSGESFDNDDNKFNSFEFDRVSQLSDLPTSISKIEGSWRDDPASISVASDGSFGGGDGECNYTGQFSVPNSSINLYNVTFNASNCTGDAAADLEGDYEGLSYYAPKSGSDPEKLVVLADNGIANQYFVFER